MILEERRNLIPPQLPADGNRPFRVNTMHVKYVLRKIGIDQDIPRSRQNPKILGRYDAEIVRYAVA